MDLPQDPIILLSVINTKLRDEFSSLDKLCDDYQQNKDEIIEKLSQVGFEYDETTNQFK